MKKDYLNLKQFKKYLRYFFLGFICIALIYCVNLWVKGVPGLFVVWNGAHYPYTNNYETPIEPLYTNLILNGEEVFADTVHSDTWGFKSTRTKLNFGYNRIEVYSNELAIYHSFDKWVFFNSKFDIWLSNTQEYFLKGNYVNLDKKEDLILKSQLDDYSIKDHELIFFNGIKMIHSYWMFYPTIIIE